MPTIRYKDGGNSWEFDALEPRTLDALVSDHIARYMDAEKF